MRRFHPIDALNAIEFFVKYVLKYKERTLSYWLLATWYGTQGAIIYNRRSYLSYMAVRYAYI